MLLNEFERCADFVQSLRTAQHAQNEKQNDRSATNPEKTNGKDHSERKPIEIEVGSQGNSLSGEG